jgi:hypothetical protein
MMKNETPPTKYYPENLPMMTLWTFTMHAMPHYRLSLTVSSKQEKMAFENDSQT